MHSDDRSRFSESTDVKSVIRHIDQLPAPPAVATKILTEVMEGDADFREISRIIASDPALTLKVLKIANSMAYGYRGKIASVESAIATIGFATLKNALLSVIIRDAFFKEPHTRDPELLLIWKHTLACAVAAELVAARVRPELRNTAFAAGIVHDCGKLVLLTALPQTYEPLLATARRTGAALLDLEAETLGVEHTQAGKWLMQKWGLPDALVDAAWLHHQSPEALCDLGPEGLCIAITALADFLAHEVMADETARPADATRDALALRFGLSETDLDDIKKRIGEGYAERADMFELEQDAALFYFEALQRANAALSGMNAELFDTGDRLRRANRILEAIAVAGPALPELRDALDIFIFIAGTLRTRLSAREGFVYRMDAQEHALEGLYWKDATTREVRLPLTDDLAPVLDAADLPDELRAALSGLRARANACCGDGLPTALSCIKPYCIAPLVTADGFAGELLFTPDIEAGRLLPQEHAGYLQLAALVSASVERMSLLARLENRAERLATALRNLKRLNAKLVQAERLAAVGQLAAGAAHEINNPLAIIYARTQLLEHKETDEKKKRDFQQMLAQIERITSILNNLMDFARPAPPRIEKTSLNDVVTRATALVQGGLGKQGIRLETALDPNLSPILGDANQLEQVLLNLLINAEHAVAERIASQGSAATAGIIRVATRLGSAGRGAVLTVTDNGVGISKDNLSKIFDPFFTTKEEGKGTGLGLSTSYGIVTGHNGDLRYDSTPGRGTTATVLLPLAVPTGTPRSTPAGEADPQAILVVDDEQHIRDILREALEARGYAVDTAEDGDKGLAKLERRRYRLMLLDIRMPARDGLSLLAHAQHAAKEMPVIILTGMAGPEEIAQAEKLGAKRCIRKPFQIEALVKDIETVLAEVKT
ncbi:HDOD domain-containing protein [Desulfobaculum xiamenense]|nr:HDOD domain-containing protein [Desulfobaculum xiamenense]